MKIADVPKTILLVFRGDSLTKRASLNAVAVALDYGARLLIGFIVTPLMVAGLGSYHFGTWQVLNRLIGYISPSSGRPTQALRLTIARDQASADPEQKRRFVGSALTVWLLFVPLTVVLGGLVVVMAPHWLKAPLADFGMVRACTALLVANLAMTSLATIPSSVLEGENLGYKRMGISAAIVLLGGVLVWLAVRFHTGIVGLAAAALITTLLSGIVFLRIAQANAKWLKVSVPSRKETRQFLDLSIWFLGWNVVMTLMTASDVVILGILKSPAAVTDYTLTKYAPETLISLIALINIGIAPGLGGIIGSGRFRKAAHIRGEMMAFTWLVTSALGATILFWNRTFLDLWVGPGHYSGPWPALLITLVVTQFALIRCDAGIIDFSLDLRRKVLVGLLSAAAAIVISGVLVGYFDLGVPGLCLGLIAGRMLLSVGYPLIVGRFLGTGLPLQLRTSLRPAVVTIVLYFAAAWLDSTLHWAVGSGMSGWLSFAAGAGLTGGAAVVAAFFLGLTSAQRKGILRRFHAADSPDLPDAVP